ncbi:MAG: class I SAM-dependent methyltransferase [Desulfovibrio sp.]|nr:class I SAM-dependent methyltransferase [Desulfovibrio sp.]
MQYTSEQEQNFDKLRLALRGDDAATAGAAMKALLRSASADTIARLLAEIESIARWELQCGVDPRVAYSVILNICKRRGDAVSVSRCARMLKIYERMRRDGVDIRSMEDCRIYMEKISWDIKRYTEQSAREAFEQSIGYWRQKRLLAAVDPLLKFFPGAQWLSLGDGRHALEARYINSRGSHGTPADVTDVVLRKDVEAGLIDGYRIERFEKLSAQDGSYDFVLAKDALHHCSRPWLGLHEMLRVAREGICFIEPCDHSFNHSVFSFPADMPADSTQGAWHGFEEGVGNYIYSFKDRETAKFCMGMGLPFLACKGYTDYYEPALDAREATEGSEALETIRSILEYADRKCAVQEADYALIAFIILKHPPLTGLRALFSDNGFRSVDLPRNTALENAFLTNEAFVDMT